LREEGCTRDAKENFQSVQSAKTIGLYGKVSKVQGVQQCRCTPSILSRSAPDHDKFIRITVTNHNFIEATKYNF